MTAPVETNLLRSLGNSYLTGPVFFGAAQEQTGQAMFFNASSVFGTSFQAGNATALVNYIFPTAGPAGNNYGLISSTTGVLSWQNTAGTYAPIDATFVTLSTNASLTNERVLTGTANQVIITDNGAGNTAVLSTPQDIGTSSNVTFGTGNFNGLLTPAAGIKGATGGGNATAGNIGQHVEAKSATFANFPASGTYGDANSISLTAGDWDVSFQLSSTINGSTWTAIFVGISPASGNDASGLSNGDNLLVPAWASSTTTPENVVVTIASFRVNVSGTTTYYGKVRANYSAGTPQYVYRLSARRVQPGT